MTTGNEVRRHDAVTLVVVTWLCLRAYWWASAKAGRMMDVVSVEALLKLALWVPICSLVLWLMYRRSSRFMLADLGLGPGLFRGLLFGLTVTAPMLVAVVVLPKVPFDGDQLIGSGLIGPFAEELLFRGFLFRQLVRRAGWSVPSAIVLSSILFGLAHARGVDLELWSAMNGPGPLKFYVTGARDGSFFTIVSSLELWWQLVTVPLLSHLTYGLSYTAGGALFAWIAYRWNSLWPAIALHGFINLSWDLTPGEYARPGYHVDLLSIAQALSVVLAIGLTIRQTRRATGSAGHTV